MAKVDARWMKFNTSQLEDSSGDLTLKDSGVTDVKLNKVYVYADGSRNMTGNLDMDSHKIVNLTDGSDAQDAVTKNQLDNAVSGLKWKDPVIKMVHYVKTTAGAPSGTGTADEVCLNTNDNKVYVYSTSWDSGTSTNNDDRYLFGLTGTDTTGNSGTYTKDNKVYEETGGVFAETSPSENDALLIQDESYNSPSDSGWTYDADSTTWVQFTGAGQIVAGDGLDKSGNTLSVRTGNGISISSDDVVIDTAVTVDISTAQTLSNKTLASPVINSSVSGSAVLDDDTFGTATDTTIATSESIKAYVDNQLNASENVVEMHKITSGEVTAGYFTLGTTPNNADSVSLAVVTGPQQVNKQSVGATGETPDFDVLSANQIHINNNGSATGLSADLTTDDIVIVMFD